MDDVVGQAEVCVETMRIASAASGARLTGVVFVRVLVAPAAREDLGAAWAIVHGAFGRHEPPGTLQGLTVLGWPAQLVEVEAVAAGADEQLDL